VRFRRQPEIVGEVCCVRKIKDIIEYTTYRRIIAGCRVAAGTLGCSLIEVEQFWRGSATPAAELNIRPQRMPQKGGVFGPSMNIALTSESQDGPTPNGGVRSTAYYTDDAGRPCPKDDATQLEIVEYDAAGQAVFRTYGQLTPAPPDGGDAE